MKRKIISICVCILMLGTLLTGCKSDDYKEACELVEAEDYTAAKEILEELGNYKDSSELAKECDYQIAFDLLSNGDFDEAVAIFKSISDYKDVSEIIGTLTSKCSDVSDRTYFYSIHAAVTISESAYREELKNTISDKVNTLWDGEYSSTPGKDVYAMLHDLDQTKELEERLRMAIGDGRDDKRYAECVLAYYFLILDNTCSELYEDSDHSLIYEWSLLLTDEDLYDNYLNLDKTIEQMYHDLLVCSSVSNVDDIITLASLTIAGLEYDWETK